MIYIVEDDSSIRELEQYALQSNGYETTGCEDAASFWAALRFGQRDGNRGLRRRPCFPFFFLNAVDRIRREVLPVLHQ